MSSTTAERPVPTPVVILVGLAVFGGGLLAALLRGPSPAVRAQDECVQPAVSGCPMALNSAVEAALGDPTVTHNWLLSVADANEFTVILTNLPGDYGLSVYGPDDSLLGTQNAAGTEDEVLWIGDAAAGTYWVVVDSPSGESSEAAYTLIATAPIVPFSAYGTLPAFQPY